MSENLENFTEAGGASPVSPNLIIKTAWELGSFMVSYAQKHNITIAVSIRMNNGCILFQHCPDGTNLLNQKWMERKFNTVKLMERSSLMSALVFERDGDTPAVHGHCGS